MKFIRKNTCAGDLFKYSRMAEGVQRCQNETPTKVFSCIYCEFFKTPTYLSDDYVDSCF